MKSAIQRLLLTVLVAVALFSVPQTSLLAQGDHKLEGSWDVVILLPLGPNQEFISTPFRILRTITSGGIVDGYGFPALTFTPGAINGAGHGDYKRLGNNLYSSTVKYFELNYSNPIPPFGSVVNSIQTIQESIGLSVDGNSYESDFVMTFTAPDGTVLGTNAGKTRASRIVVP